MNETSENSNRRKRRGVQVVVRIRPLNPVSNATWSAISVNSSPASTTDGLSSQITVLDRYAWCGVGEERSFTVNSVLDTNVSNAEVFQLIVKPKLVKITKENPDTLCFLAYGHTCSGKTHTIAGGESVACNTLSENKKAFLSGNTPTAEEKKPEGDANSSKFRKDLAPQTLRHLMLSAEKCNGREQIQRVHEEPGLLTLCVEDILRREGVVEVAMLEVYMEQIYDLLAHGAQRRIRRRRHATSGEYHVMVEGLKTCVITSMKQWNVVARFSMQSRRVTATDRNVRSSRSHALFTLKSPSVRLCLVDLAGSERQTTFSTKLNEVSVSINKSLSRLSTALQALSAHPKLEKREEVRKKAYVNFRDTTLTILLQRYLTGSSQTTFLACVHPEECHIQETMSTLRYTERIRRIKTSAFCGNESEEQNRALLMDLYDEEASDHHLLEELVRLREQVKNQEATQELLLAHQQRIAELEASLSAEKTDLSRPYPSALSDTLSSLSGQECRKHANVEEMCTEQRDGKAVKQKRIPGETLMNKRLTRWLLLRLLHALPPLFVRFDDFFDSLLPRSIQVVGYVTTMASFPPPFYRTFVASTSHAAPALSNTSTSVPPGAHLRHTRPSVSHLQLPHHLRRKGLFDEISSSSSDDDEDDKAKWRHMITQEVSDSLGRASRTSYRFLQQEESLAFIEVGDFSMGLSMLDGGIPPLVQLHRPHCRSASHSMNNFLFTKETENYRAYAPNQDGSSVSEKSPSSRISQHYNSTAVTVEDEDEKLDDYFILAFFQVSPETVSEEKKEDRGRYHSYGGDGTLLSGQCCATVVSTEPLLPIAIVWCVRADAPLSVKDNALQRLSLLTRTEQPGKEDKKPGYDECVASTTNKEFYMHSTSWSTNASERGIEKSAGSGVSGLVTHGLSSSMPSHVCDKFPSGNWTEEEEREGETNDEMLFFHSMAPPTALPSSLSRKEDEKQDKKKAFKVREQQVEEKMEKEQIKKLIFPLFSPSPPSSCSATYSTERTSLVRSPTDSHCEKSSPSPAPPVNEAFPFGFHQRGFSSSHSPTEQVKDDELPLAHSLHEGEEANMNGATTCVLLGKPKEEIENPNQIGLLDLIAQYEQQTASRTVYRSGSARSPSQSVERWCRNKKTLMDTEYRNGIAVGDTTNVRNNSDHQNSTLSSTVSSRESVGSKENEEPIPENVSPKSPCPSSDFQGERTSPSFGVSPLVDAEAPLPTPTSSTVVVERSPQGSLSPPPSTAIVMHTLPPSLSSVSPSYSSHYHHDLQKIMETKEPSVLSLPPPNKHQHLAQTLSEVLNEKEASEMITKKRRRHHHQHCNRGVVISFRTAQSDTQKDERGNVVQCNVAVTLPERRDTQCHTTATRMTCKEATLPEVDIVAGGKNFHKCVRKSSFSTIPTVSSSVASPNCNMPLSRITGFGTASKSARDTQSILSGEAFSFGKGTRSLSPQSLPPAYAEFREGKNEIASTKCDTCLVM